MKCSICGSKAEIYQPHTGLKLCFKCFKQQIIKRVVNEVKRWNLFGKNDTLMLALSGGKDSFTLLDIISTIHPSDKIIAVTVVEGISGSSRKEEAEAIRKIAMSRGIDHTIISFKEVYGMSLDDMVAESIRRELDVKACTFCGVLRRKILDEAAKELGATRVVTAHNLDDEVQTALMNILRGDFIGLLKLHPISSLSTRLFVPRVKPLRKIYEWEAAIYAVKSGYRIRSLDCPYLKLMPTLRLSIRLELYKIEHKNPGTLLKLLESLDNILAKYAGKYIDEKQLGQCQKCRAPTSPGRRLCKTCELLELVGAMIPPRKPVLSYSRFNYKLAKRSKVL